jgi:hypothetical protein
MLWAESTQHVLALPTTLKPRHTPNTDWVDNNHDGAVDYYCHKIRWGAGCPWINRLAIDRFRFGLQWCLAKAVDAVRARAGWRGHAHVGPSCTVRAL